MEPKLKLIDDILEKRVSARKQVQDQGTLWFLAIMAILYFTSALLDDEIVKSYIPTVPYRCMIRGYSRKIAEIGVSLLVVFSMSILIFYRFNNNTRGLKIFKSIKSLMPFADCCLNCSQFEKLRRITSRVLKFSSQLEMVVQVSVLFNILMPTLVLPQESLWQYLLLSIGQLMSCPMALLHNYYIMTPLTHLYIINTYFKIRIRKLILMTKIIIDFRKQLIVRSNLRISFAKLLKRLLESHNSVCYDIAVYSDFWKVFYFLALLFMIPNNLFFLHVTLFGNQPLLLKGGFFVIFLMGFGYIFIVGLMFANASYHIERTRIHLGKLLLLHQQLMSFRQWIQLMNCIDRVSTKTRPVGFTCLTIFTVTNASVFKVAVIYARFFLLTHMHAE